MKTQNTHAEFNMQTCLSARSHVLLTTFYKEHNAVCITWKRQYTYLANDKMSLINVSLYGAV